MQGGLGHSEGFSIRNPVRQRPGGPGAGCWEQRGEGVGGRSALRPCAGGSVPGGPEAATRARRNAVPCSGVAGHPAPQQWGDGKALHGERLHPRAACLSSVDSPNREPQQDNRVSETNREVHCGRRWMFSSNFESLCLSLWGSESTGPVAGAGGRSPSESVSLPSPGLR